MTLYRGFRPRPWAATCAVAIGAALLAGACGGTNSGGATDAPRVAAKRPNILYIMADDLGYSDIGAFGGEIDTPNLDALVREGRILTNHHVGTVCAITRAMLISGTDHHLVGEGTMGVPNDERRDLPGYEGYLNDRALSVAQLLKDNGYHTYISGKWHLGGIVDATVNGGHGPEQWGFERSFVLLHGAATNHFAHEPAGSRNYTENGVAVQPGQPGQPGGTGGRPAVFYSTDFYTQKLIEYIDSNRGDGKPFFAYAAYTSPHWPLQVPEPYLHKYAGRYDAGYDAIRDARVARQKALGIIPADFTPYPGAPERVTMQAPTAGYGKPGAKYVSAVHNPADGYVDYGPGLVKKKWASLSAAEKKAQARYMEIYAGMVDNLDHNIGLLIQHLKDIGEYDNTFIMFQSDNGAESQPIDPIGDPTAVDIRNASEPVYSALGTDNGQAAAQHVTYGIRWAEVSATPFRMTKMSSGEGGVSTPLIVRLPGQHAQLPTLRTFSHVTDNTATFLDLAGVAPPTQPAPPLVNTLTGVDQNAGKVVYGNRYVYPVTGASLLPLLTGKTNAAPHAAPFGDEAYGAGYLRSADGRWKALWTAPPTGPADGHWELFDLAADRGETNDVSAQHPDLVDTLVRQWNDYMTRVGGVEPLMPLALWM
ncbi:arylsulfatase [Burkholderia cenocepacia]|uniref:arylsulfatase n=1 Tax=Burkholderia cenocepacia TaxID=95486 RepID=UPI001CF1768F|nr:arylsulfatase [Burkholderia cenocepacia]MCA7923112.1 arylsulfatase [Burkholderia cenocepacia]